MKPGAQPVRRRLGAWSIRLEVGQPFEQLQIDRALPDIELRAQQGARYAQAATGSTRTDAYAQGQAAAESPWAIDFHFVAPPQ